jgi:integrase
MQRMLKRVETEILEGTFDYATFFPGSKLAGKFESGTQTSSLVAPLVPARAASSASATPLFSAFIEEWVVEFAPMWRASHVATLQSTISLHLVPYFGDMPIGAITKADILQFRAGVARRKGRSGNETLSAKTINRIMQILSQVLAEAAERYGFTNPAARVKRLKQRRVDIHPFSLAETRQIIETVRTDYQPYMTVRFLTGMRTGELHGLKWKYVDFEHHQILVRETWVRGRVEYTKTDGSQREITMSAPVYEALLEQHERTGNQEYVFCTANGAPLDNDNFTNRVWYPLLRHLDLGKRRPYQTRHTCATLWLAAGENPEWVARQLGHVNTMMLFKTYSRFVPNLTRSDGAAMERLLAARVHAPNVIGGSATAIEGSP